MIQQYTNADLARDTPDCSDLHYWLGPFLIKLKVSALNRDFDFYTVVLDRKKNLRHFVQKKCVRYLHVIRDFSIFLKIGLSLIPLSESYGIHCVTL